MPTNTHTITAASGMGPSFSSLTGRLSQVAYEA